MRQDTDLKQAPRGGFRSQAVLEMARVRLHVANGRRLRAQAIADWLHAIVRGLSWPARKLIMTPLLHWRRRSLATRLNLALDARASARTRAGEAADE